MKARSGERKYSLTKDGALWLPQGWNSVAALYVGQDSTSEYTQSNQQYTASGNPTVAAMNTPNVWSSNVIRFQIAQSQLHDKSAQQIDDYLSMIQQLGLIALNSPFSFDAIILCMYPQGPAGYADNPCDKVSPYTTAAWENVANWFFTDTRFMFELLNEPTCSSDSDWKNTFQTLVNNIRVIAPDNVCIVPAYNPHQTTLPSTQSESSLLTGSQISYSVHGYWDPGYIVWPKRQWKCLYGWVNSYAPVLMTEVIGHCTNPPDSEGWPTAPKDFTNMLDYNRSNNIGVMVWPFDDPTDENDAVITALDPDHITAPWTWAAADCSGLPKSWRGHNIYKPGAQYSNWMLGH